METEEVRANEKISYSPAIDSIEEIELEITALESRIKSYQKNDKILYGFLGIMIILSITFMFIGPWIFYMARMESSANSVPLFSMATIVYTFIFGAYVVILRSSKVGSLQRDLDVLKAKRRITSQSSLSGSRDQKLSYFDRLVEINISNLEAYYKLVKEHTNNSFLSSITAGAIGFILIGGGIVIGFTAIQETKYIAYLSAGSGILTEFISGVFFYLYNRTVRQLKDYHDSLIAVQNILLSFKIVGDTKDNNKQAALMEQMLKCLIKVSND